MYVHVFHPYVAALTERANQGTGVKPAGPISRRIMTKVIAPTDRSGSRPWDVTAHPVISAHAYQVHPSGLVHKRAVRPKAATAYILTRVRASAIWRRDAPP